MIRNYIKTAWRNLRANKFYSVINISGLAVGLATGIMLLLWVQHERSYDKLHQHYKSIYKLSTHFTAGTEEVTWQTVPAPLSVLSKSIPRFVMSSVSVLNTTSFLQTRIAIRSLMAMSPPTWIAVFFPFLISRLSRVAGAECFLISNRLF